MDSSYWDAKFDTDDYIYTTVVNRFVKEYCEPLIAKQPKGKMIDLAGGEGRNAIWFSEQGWQSENIDWSKKALSKSLKLAEERGVSALHFAHIADATGFESVLTPVDIGVVAYLQVPHEDLADALYTLVDNVRKGGHILGVWHALDNLDGGYGGPRDPAVLPSVESLTEICEELDVEIEVLTNRDGQVQTNDGLKPSITVVLLARRL
jgi:SAM-dependent methyltransferase